MYWSIISLCGLVATAAADSAVVKAFSSTLVVGQCGASNPAPFQTLNVENLGQCYNFIQAAEGVSVGDVPQRIKLNAPAFWIYEQGNCLGAAVRSIPMTIFTTSDDVACVSVSDLERDNGVMFRSIQV